MGLSKSTRILILLAIDSAFFVLELTVGYAVHSLALVADSFHMLNDVLSLCVGLWAVKVANQKSSSRYTYGWQRAETLGALVNGVFLVALCLSIFLDAIQRFVEPQEVSNPKLVLIVGCLGLASNILGLFLFHDHGHSHGGEEHGHSHADENGLSAAEEGHGHVHNGKTIEYRTSDIGDEGGNIIDVLPESVLAQDTTHKSKSRQETAEHRRASHFGPSDEESATAAGSSSSPVSTRRSMSSHYRQGHRRQNSGSRSRPFASPEDIHIHPASFRNEIIAASRLDTITSNPETESENEEAVENEVDRAPTEGSPLLGKRKGHRHETYNKSLFPPLDPHDSWHHGHKHNEPKTTTTGGGHSHGDLNMRGVFLHVMGDALGNIGVIGSALIIWLTPYPWRFYSDPLISLVITCIILASAIPLCKAASRILLQAVPAGISIEDIKYDIQELPGIISCHHLHVWQLSDTKMVASLHIQVEFDFKGEGSARYMDLARAVRRCLHEYGIHSSTIQPEFCLDKEHGHDGSNSGNGALLGSGLDGSASKIGTRTPSRAGSSHSSEHACLLDCGDECGTGGQCCAPPGGEPEVISVHSH